MPAIKAPKKAKPKTRPAFGDWAQAKVTAVLVLADGSQNADLGVG